MEETMIMARQMERELQFAESEKFWRHYVPTQQTAKTGARRMALRQQVAQALVALAGRLAPADLPVPGTAAQSPTA